MSANGNIKLGTKKGFSLVELVLAMAIFGLIITLSTNIDLLDVNRNNLSAAEETLQNAIKISRSNSQAGLEDSEWGVYVDDTTATVFSGPSYSGRTSSLDEIFDLPAGIEFSSTSEIIIDELSHNISTPNPPITITLNASSGNSKNVIINKYGIIN